LLSVLITNILKLFIYTFFLFYSVGAVDFVALTHSYSVLICFRKDNICKSLLAGHNLVRANFDEVSILSCMFWNYFLG